MFFPTRHLQFQHLFGMFFHLHPTLRNSNLCAYWMYQPRVLWLDFWVVLDRGLEDSEQDCNRCRNHLGLPTQTRILLPRTVGCLSFCRDSAWTGTSNSGKVGYFSFLLACLLSSPLCPQISFQLWLYQDLYCIGSHSVRSALLSDKLYCLK